MQEAIILGKAGGAQGAPVGHGALLSDSITPHAEAHAHDGAGDEDQADHEGADQQVQEGVEEGAAARGGGAVTAPPTSPQHPCGPGGSRKAAPDPRVPSWGWAPDDRVGPSGPTRGRCPSGSVPHPQAHAPARAAQPVLPKPGTGDRLIAESRPPFKPKAAWFRSIGTSTHAEKVKVDHPRRYPPRPFTHTVINAAGLHLPGGL